MTKAELIHQAEKLEAARAWIEKFGGYWTAMPTWTQEPEGPKVGDVLTGEEAEEYLCGYPCRRVQGDDGKIRRWNGRVEFLIFPSSKTWSGSSGYQNITHTVLPDAATPDEVPK